MSIPRRYVLGGIFVFFASISIVILLDVLGTVFLAMTIAYLLIPVHKRVRRRGVPNWWAAVITTFFGFFAVIALISPLFLTLYFRLDLIRSFISSLPKNLTFEFFGNTYPIDADLVLSLARRFVSNEFIAGIVSAVPIIAIKLMLFVLLIFALLLRHGDGREAFMAVVPEEYMDVALRLEKRARSTLYAIYVIQAATAVATFAIALPIFVAFGYRFPVTLSVLSGILQFIPVLGPSIVILSIAAYEVVINGVLTKAALLTGVGLVFIGWLPDAVIRPRLARRTTHLPGSLYFVGFTGGVLSLGPIGVIAGPLIVALTAESMTILAEENKKNKSDEESAEVGTEDIDQTKTEDAVAEEPNENRGDMRDTEQGEDGEVEGEDGRS